MKIKILSVALAAVAIAASCSDSTDDIGSSIAQEVDNVIVSTASYDVESNSILADSVLSRNTVGYLGKVRDPETNNYITGNFMAQFFSLENYKFPDLNRLVTYDNQGNEIKGIVKADSCELRLFYSNFYGDSTRTMKLTAYEMSKPMNEDRNYYSNFDPESEGYLRHDGIHKDKVYSLTDFMVPKHTRDTVTYEPYITMKLNDSYTAQDGTVYSNYGSYVMQKFYDDSLNFKNAYTFRNNVVPGFYFKHKSGLGSMAYIDASQLNVYYKYVASVEDTTVNGVTQYKDSVMNGVTVFWGTEEVLQTTNVTNDKSTLAKLAADESCTYLKTPAGIFTELTLPVEDIVNNHKNDNLAGAKLSIQRINNSSSSDYTFDVPKNILMIPKDSLYSFFEKGENYNNRTSFLASWGYSSSAKSNSYTFNNISGMINAMAAIDENQRSTDWNKVVLVPVTLTRTSTSSSSSSSYYYYYSYYSSSSQQTTVTKVSHDMSLSSTRLVKGTTNNSPIKLEVIYSRFK